MTWTTQHPTTSGWYFWRNTTTQDMGVRYVDVSAEWFWDGGLEWAGPIAEPGKQ